VIEVPDTAEARDVNFYRYVGNNPINSTDPYGLLNFLLGGGVSAVLPIGGEASGGIVINPGIGNDRADIGLFGSAGLGAGLNVSADLFAGIIKGDLSNVRGETANINLVLGPISLSLFTDPKNGELIGGTVGYGPSATPVGASGTISITGILTLRDLIDYIRKFNRNDQLSPIECH